MTILINQCNSIGLHELRRSERVKLKISRNISIRCYRRLETLTHWHSHNRPATVELEQPRFVTSHKKNCLLQFDIVIAAAQAAAAAATAAAAAFSNSTRYVAFYSLSQWKVWSNDSASLRPWVTDETPHGSRTCVSPLKTCTTNGIIE